MKIQRIVFAIGIAFMVSSFLFAAVSTSYANPNEGHKVNLCHAHDPHTWGSWVMINPDYHSFISHGHDGHSADIIPPFSFTKKNGKVISYGGKNWTAEGEAIYNNGCNPVATPEPTETQPPAPTQQPTQEPTIEPTVIVPTDEPPTNTPEPTLEPTLEPTVVVTEDPTDEPTIEPTIVITPTEEVVEEDDDIHYDPPPADEDDDDDEVVEIEVETSQPAATEAPAQPSKCENREGRFIVTGLGKGTDGVDLVLVHEIGYTVFKKDGNQYDANVVQNCLIVNLEGRDGEIHYTTFEGFSIPVKHDGQSLYAVDIHSNGNGTVTYKDHDGNVVVTDGTFNVLTTVLKGTELDTKVFVSPDGDVVVTTVGGFVTFAIVSNDEVEVIETKIEAEDILGWNDDGSAFWISNDGQSIRYSLSGEKKFVVNERLETVEETSTEFEIVATILNVSFTNGNLDVTKAIEIEGLFINRPDYWTFDRPEFRDTVALLKTVKFETPAAKAEATTKTIAGGVASN